MVKLLLRNPETGGLSLMLGVSGENIGRLLTGMPIEIALESMGLSLSAGGEPRRGTLVLFFGATEAIIVERLARHGITCHPEGQATETKQ